MNNYRRIRELLPLPPVLVGIVLEIHDDDTSTVEIPGNLPLTGYGDGSTATGSLLRPRGSHVPVGELAFVRAGVIETRAPKGVPTDIPIGKVIFEIEGAASVGALAKTLANVTLSASGGAPVVGSTWDPTWNSASLTYTNGNKTVEDPLYGGAYRNTRGTTSHTTVGGGALWYFEVGLANDSSGTAYSTRVGIVDSAFSGPGTVQVGATSFGWAVRSVRDSVGTVTTDLFHTAASTSFSLNAGRGDTIMVAVNLTAFKMWIGVNGTWGNGGDPAAGTNASFTSIAGNVGQNNVFYPGVSLSPAFPSDTPPSTSIVTTLRSVSSEFVYSPPSGFSQWG